MKGQKYYYETFTKEGGGDDHFGVGWQLPDGTLDRPISARHLLPFNQIFTGTPDGITNTIKTINGPTFSIERWTGYNAAPSQSFYSGQPQSQTGTEGSNVVIEATVIGIQPMTMQWFRTTNNGAYVAIPGATLQHYTVSNLNFAAHNNTQYRLAVTNANAGVLSSPATLSVDPDTTKPTLLSANAFGRNNGLTVAFSEAVTSTALATNNYYITNAVTGFSAKILSATFWGADQKRVNLLTEAFPTVPSLYTVVVSGVRDTALAPNTIVANSSADFNSVYRDGNISLRYFTNITTGGLVANLTNDTKFINNLPYLVENRTLFEGPTTYADNYGIQYVGYIVPPTNGDYSFYVSSDDQSILWLSTDTSPANKKAIAAEPNNSGVRVWFNGGAPRYDNSGNAALITTTFGIVAPMNVSKPVTLQANTRYYIEYLMKEGGGGDNGAVAWQIPGGAVVANNSTPIEGAYLSTTNVGGVPITITAQPVNATFADQANATFTVVAAGTAPQYQWYRGTLSSNAPVADATAATLTTDPVTFQDQGLQFFAVVNNGFSAATSSVVTLSIIADTVKPTLVRARGDGEFSLITVSFSERLNGTSSTNLANYTVTPGITVNKAVLGLGRTNVVLTTSLMNTGTVYTVTVSGVQDSSSASNVITAASSVQFSSWVQTRGFALRQTYLNINGTAISDLLGSSLYPDFPDTTDYIGISLNSPQTVPGLDNFGVRLTGTITPQLFDLYRFLVTSDDASAMYIGTNNLQNSVNPVPVANQEGANVAFSLMPGTGNYVFPRMEAGVPYAFRLLMKEGGGGDFVRAAWVGGINGGDAMSNDALLDALPSIPAVFLSVYADPVGANVGVSVQPIAAITTNEVFQVRLSLVATGAISGLVNPPISYIWQRKRTSDADFVDFVDNNGETTFLTPRLQYPADNGARFRCLVSVPGKGVYSSETLFTIGQDTTPPVIVRSAGNRTYDTVTVSFNEPINIGNLSALSVTSTNGDPDLTVSNPRIVNLTNLVITTSQQATNVRYTVTLSGVRDIALVPNTIAPNSTTSFRGWIIGRGGVTAQRFLSLGTATGAGGLDVLRNAAKFPNSPDQQWMMNQSLIPQSGGADLRTAGASPGLDGFGGRMYGYIVPPTNNSYVFYINSDDSSEVRISTDADPANMVLVGGDRASCCQGASDTFANVYPITASNARVHRWTNTFVANQLYYFEVMFKEGGGGDNAQLIWKDRNNTAAPSGTGYIQATNLASIINPDDSSIEFRPNLTNVITLENRNITFNGLAIARSFFTLPGANFSDAVTYQWQSDAGGGTGFTNISGQTGATLTRLLSMTNNGFQFRVVASVTIPIAMTVTSAVSTVTIALDTTLPVLTSVRRDAYFTNVYLNFNELMAPNSVTNVLNYSITNAAGTSIEVKRASLRNATNIVLETSLMATGATYRLTVSPTNVIGDLSAAGTNIIAGFSRDFNTFVQVDGYLLTEYFLNIGGTSLANVTNVAGYLQNNVDILRYTNSANIAATSPNIDNFGARLYGFFKPLTNGDYTFYIRGDDSTGAYLTTNGVRQVVASRDGGCCATYETSNPLNNNTPVTNKVVVSLTGGVYYPLEAIVKEGGGGDSLELAFSANGQAVPATGGAATIPGTFLSTFADPDPAVINITSQPASIARGTGATATFTVTATGSSPLPASSIRYQWSSNGVPILNATNNSHTTPSLTAGADGAQYQVRAYLPEKGILSSIATLTIGTVPAITVQVTPSSVITNVGSNVTFTVTANGSPTPAYQWRRNGTNVGGATLTLLTLNNVQLANQGSYTVVISNAIGSVTSSPAATLQVLVTPYMFGGSTKTGGGFGTSFGTDAGRSYVVEFKNALTNASWTLLTNVVGTGSPAIISDPGATGPERYYKITTTFP